MKKQTMFFLAVCMMTACENPVFDEEPAEQMETVTKQKKFTFTVKGEFSDNWKPVTRGYLQADGKDMTDLWVLDYMDGQLVQQLHQGDNTADDFGKPAMSLAYGQHHVYFIASRGADPTLNTTSGTISWASVRDTYWKDYEVSVVSTSNGNRAVTLDRVVSRLSLCFSDAISADAATINMTPSTWYYTLNYKTGEPTAATTSQTISMNVPASFVGSTDVLVTYFSLSPSTEWTTDVTINSKDGSGSIIGQATMSAVPMKRNRSTNYSGPLFTAGGEMSLSLAVDWLDAYQGTW